MDLWRAIGERVVTVVLGRPEAECAVAEEGVVGEAGEVETLVPATKRMRNYDWRDKSHWDD